MESNLYYSPSPTVANAPDAYATEACAAAPSGAFAHDGNVYAAAAYGATAQTSATHTAAAHTVTATSN